MKPNLPTRCEAVEWATILRVCSVGAAAADPLEAVRTRLDAAMVAVAMLVVIERLENLNMGWALFPLEENVVRRGQWNALKIPPFGSARKRVGRLAAGPRVTRPGSMPP